MAEIAVLMAAWIRTAEQQSWLAEAIASVRAQTFADWELVIADDDSPAAWRPALDGLDARVHILRLPTHGGPAVARNLAAAYTRAPWLFCLDADDRLKPDALARLYAVRSASEYVYGDLEFVGDRTGFYAIRAWNMDDLRKVTGPIGVTALQSRRLWKALGGWREDLAGLEDIEYWIRAAECGVRGKHLQGAIFEYRIHAASRTTSFMSVPGRGRQLADAVRAMHQAFLGEPINTRKDANVMTGKVDLVYVGRRQASFPLQRSPLNRDYRVDGIGAHLHIDAEELNWFLSFRENGQPMFRVFVPEPPVIPPTPVIQPPPDFESMVVESSVPKITEMNAKQAAQAVMDVDNLLDLRLLASVENATQRRTTVEKAVNARGRELAGETWTDVSFGD